MPITSLAGASGWCTQYPDLTRITSLEYFGDLRPAHSPKRQF